jgi:hypothetical protein
MANKEKHMLDIASLYNTLESGLKEKMTLMVMFIHISDTSNLITNFSLICFIRNSTDVCIQRCGFWALLPDIGLIMPRMSR